MDFPGINFSFFSNNSTQDPMFQFIDMTTDENRPTIRFRFANGPADFEGMTFGQLESFLQSYERTLVARIEELEDQNESYFNQLEETNNQLSDVTNHRDQLEREVHRLEAVERRANDQFRIMSNEIQEYQSRNDDLQEQLDVAGQQVAELNLMLHDFTMHQLDSMAPMDLPNVIPNTPVSDVNDVNQFDFNMFDE